MKNEVMSGVKIWWKNWEILPKKREIYKRNFNQNQKQLWFWLIFRFYICREKWKNKRCQTRKIAKHLKNFPNLPSEKCIKIKIDPILIKISLQFFANIFFKKREKSSEKWIKIDFTLISINFSLHFFTFKFLNTFISHLV